jgi:hypothetical protein
LLNHYDCADGLVLCREIDEMRLALVVDAYERWTGLLCLQA